MLSLVLLLESFEKIWWHITTWFDYTNEVVTWILFDWLRGREVQGRQNGGNQMRADLRRCRRSRRRRRIAVGSDSGGRMGGRAQFPAHLVALVASRQDGQPGRRQSRRWRRPELRRRRRRLTFFFNDYSFYYDVDATTTSKPFFQN